MLTSSSSFQGLCSSLLLSGGGKSSPTPISHWLQITFFQSYFLHFVSFGNKSYYYQPTKLPSSRPILLKPWLVSYSLALPRHFPAETCMIPLGSMAPPGLSHMEEKDLHSQSELPFLSKTYYMPWELKFPEGLSA